MKLHESIQFITGPLIRPSDNAKIDATKNDQGNIIVTGGPFQRIKKDLGPTGQLDAEWEKKVTDWYEGGEGDGDGQEAGPEEPTLTKEEQEVAEGAALCDELAPGTGLGGAMQAIYNKLRRGDSRVHRKMWSRSKNSGSLINRLVRTLERRQDIRAEIDFEANTIRDATGESLDRVDVARAMTNLLKLIEWHENMDGISPSNLKLMMSMMHVAKAHDGRKIFIRVQPDSNGYGISLNLSPNDPVGLALDKIFNDCRATEKQYRKEGKIGEDELPYEQNYKFADASRSGGNVSNTIKEVSEDGEEVIDLWLRGERGKASTMLLGIMKKFADVVDYAMNLDGEFLDERSMETMEMLGMAADQPKDMMEGFAKLMTGLLKRRRNFHQTMNPDRVVRVGGGDVGVGYKPDVLYLYKEKPTGAKEKYAYFDKDRGMWAIGVSLKTYRKTGETKAGETNSVSTATQYLLDKTSHAMGVLKQMGLGTKAAGQVRQAAREMNNVANFCKGLQSLKALGNLDFNQSVGVVKDQLMTTLKANGITLPPDMTDDVITQALETAKGEKRTQQAYISKLSVYLEKEMNLKMLDGAKRPDGTLDPKHPHAMLQTYLYCQAGVDTQNGVGSDQGQVPVMNATSFMDSNESFDYNANDRLLDTARGCLDGSIPMTYSRGSVQLGNCEKLNYSSESNRNIVQAYSKHNKQC